MKSGRCVAVAAALLLVWGPAGSARAAQPERELLDRYCVTCHNARNQGNAGGLALDSFDVSAPASRPEIAEKMVGKLRAGLMPPAGNRRPDPAQQSALIKYLERDLDRQAAASPNPGRTEAFHRLNRAEYRNAVRDLLNLEMDVTAYLPSDDASFGFDNIAGVLKISQSRLEQYLGAARRISRAALGAPRG
jgi:mono/diheme cytochrome c family protein